MTRMYPVIFILFFFFPGEGEAGVLSGMSGSNLPQRHYCLGRTDICCLLCHVRKWEASSCEERREPSIRFHFWSFWKVFLFFIAGVFTVQIVFMKNSDWRSYFSSTNVRYVHRGGRGGVHVFPQTGRVSSCCRGTVYWVLKKRPIVTERRNVLCFFCNLGDASRGGWTGPAEYGATTAAPSGGAKSIQKHCHKVSHGVVFIIFIVILVKKKRRKKKKVQQRKKTVTILKTCCIRNLSICIWIMNTLQMLQICFPSFLTVLGLGFHS